jgi:Domain of unknown function (DUF6378)
MSGEPEDVKTSIAEEASRIVRGARRGAYGTPERNFERIAALWNAYLSLRMPEAQSHGYGPDLEPRDVAAMMRLMKEARLLETPDHRDSFVDLVGYTLCGAEVSGVK